VYIRKLKPGDRFTVDGIEVKLIDIGGGHILLGVEGPDGGELRLERLPTDQEKRSAFRAKVEANRLARRSRYEQRQGQQEVAVVDVPPPAVVPPASPAVVHYQFHGGHRCVCGDPWPHR
jgi:C-terminal processing protease CtpA/Prc